MCGKEADASFADIAASTLLLEEKMKLSRDLSMGSRVRTVCAAVLMAVLGVKPGKNSARMTYFSGKKQPRRIESKIGSILACSGFASCDQVTLLAGLDFAINDGTSEAHVQSTRELAAEVSICQRAFASSAALREELHVQYRILKEFKELSELI